MRLNVRTALTAAENTRVGQITDDASDAGVMPGFPCSGTITLVVQESCNALSAKSFINILIKNDSYDLGFGFIDCQIIKLVLPLIRTVWA